MSRWPVGETDADARGRRELSLDVIVRIMFGVNDSDDVARIGEPFDELLVLAISEETAVRYAARRLGALRFWGRLNGLNRRIDELVLPMIAARRADPGREAGIGMLVDARSEMETGCRTRRFATTSSPLCSPGMRRRPPPLAWVVDLLLHHPKTLDRVREEAVSGTTYTGR